MDLLDDHTAKKHGSDTSGLKMRLSNRSSDASGAATVRDKHEVTFEEFCNALQGFAKDANSSFNSKLERASSSHKNVFRSNAPVASTSISAKLSTDGSDVSSVREIDSKNISQEVGTSK